MIYNLKTALNISKRQSLYSILNNFEIKFPYLKTKIIDYITNGDNTFNTLLSNIDIKPQNISSSQLNAILFLGYMDFYSLLIIATANNKELETLLVSTNNKFIFALKSYFEINKIKEDKSKLPIFKNIISLDTESEYLFNSTLSLKSSRNIINSNILSKTNMITLPIKKTMSIEPYSIVCFDNDKSNNIITNTITNNSIDYSINRRQSNRIGIIKNIQPAKDSIGYKILPSISGSFEYYADRLFIEILTINNNNITYRASTDKQEWSSSIATEFNASSSIKIENDLDIGLTIIFYDSYNLKESDSWLVSMGYIELQSPSLNTSIKFESLDKVSYIKFLDISPYKLDINSIKFKKIKSSNLITIDNIYNNNIHIYAPINDKIENLDINFTQKEYIEDAYDSSLVANYNFSIENIEGIKNSYLQHGNLSTYGEELKDITSIYLESLDYIYINNIQKSFIEYSVILENGTSKIIIPILPKTNSLIIKEYVIPSSVDSGNLALYTPRFPIDNSYQIKYINLSSGIITNIEEQDKESLGNNYYRISISDFNTQNTYLIEYKLKVFDIDNFSVINNYKKDGLLAYLYMKDVENNIFLSVKEKNINNYYPYSGIAYGNIEMRSIENDYISPMIYNYRLMFK